MSGRRTIKNVERVVREFRRRVERRLGFPVEVRLFGSYVRGEATEESDIDVVVVVPSLNSAVLDTLLDLAWEVGFEAGCVLSVTPVGRAEIERLKPSPFWQSVERESVVI